MSKNTHLTIVSRSKNGFRRAGYEFSSETAKHIALDDLTKDQIEQLKGEPNLVCLETNGEGQASAAQSDVEVEALKKQVAELAADKTELESKLKDRSGEIAKLKEQIKGLEAEKAGKKPAK